MQIRGADGNPTAGERVILTSLLAARARRREWIDLSELCEAAARVLGVRGARETTIAALAHHVAAETVGCQVASAPPHGPVAQFGLRLPGVEPSPGAARVLYSGDGCWAALAGRARISGLHCLEDATEAAVDLLGQVGR